MGEVWEARHTQLDALVAIKFIVEHRAHDSAFSARFRREACAMARLRGPDTVQVFDAGVFDGLPFLVMELLDGEPLRNLLERDGLLPLTTVERIARQISRALAVVHREGMVHRDVTPGNIFILTPTPEYPKLRCKLLDFGIAKQLVNDTRLTTSGALIGSPAYMSPEHARSEGLDTTSDLWSLGAVLYRCVTGVDAFDGKNMTDVLINICTGEVPQATRANPKLPGELDGFFARSFARNPKFRFQSATEMGEAFTQIVQSFSATNEISVYEDDVSSRAVSISHKPRTNTATILATKHPSRNWLRRTFKGRITISVIALSVGAVMGGMFTKIRHTTETSRTVLKSSSSSFVRDETFPNPNEAKIAISAPIANPSSFKDSARDVPLAPTSPSPIISVTKTRKKPTNSGIRSTSTIDPIFGLPETVR